MNPARKARFEELFRNNYAAVRAYALRRAPSDVAQDVVAETFLVAWRRLDDVPEDALPWLYGIARRVLANERRSAGRRAALEQRVATDAATGGTSDGSGHAPPDRDRRPWGSVRGRVTYLPLTQQWSTTIDDETVGIVNEFSVYERLPLDASSRANLALDPHPDAECSAEADQAPERDLGFPNPCAR